MLNEGAGPPNTPQKVEEQKGEQNWLDDLILDASTETPKTDQAMKNWIKGEQRKIKKCWMGKGEQEPKEDNLVMHMIIVMMIEAKERPTKRQRKLWA
jgi:hypothetical protein